MAEFAVNGDPRSATSISSLSGDEIRLLSGQSGQHLLLDFVIRDKDNCELLLLADRSGSARLIPLTYEPDLLSLLLQRILREVNPSVEDQTLDALQRIVNELEKQSNQR